MNTSSEKNIVRLNNVTKTYKTVNGNIITAVDSLSFNIDRNEFITIVGPSGSGKSTILQLIAGIEKQSKGRIEYPNNELTHKIGFVFQSNTLFPWRTVEKNLSYPLELNGCPKNERRKVVTEVCESIGLNPHIYLHKYPKELSGGEQRRVSVGMALTYRANILLLDEPTSQLDFLAKQSLQELIVKLWMKEKMCVVLVTHDLDEAINLGQRIIILGDGQLKNIIQVDLPYPRDESIRNNPLYNKYIEKIINDTTTKNVNRITNAKNI